jgi:hypothetical protein
MLCCYVDELKEGFFPYIQPTVETMVSAFPTQHVPPLRLPILVPEGTIALTV